MSNKLLVYTSNLETMPRNMSDVIEFAKSKPKFYISSVELNGTLKNVREGDNIITKKGNSLYVIKAIQNSLDSLSEDEQTYLDRLSREYGLKKVNITSVDQIINFGSWCKSAKVFVNNVKEQKMANKASIKGYSARLKDLFLPKRAEDIRVATDGNICVATSEGYVAIDANNELTSYPEEFTIDLPVFIISKPKEQLQVGDVIALAKSYAKVTKIDGSKITAIGYTGSGKTVHTVKDFLFNQTMVRVVVSLAGNIQGQINPMMLLAMKDDNDSLLPFLLMSQNNGAVGMNPMMLALLADKKGGDDSLRDLLMMSAFSGNNLFSAFNAAPQKEAPAKEAVNDDKEPLEEPEEVEEVK